MPTNFWGKSNIVVVPTFKAIFGFGNAPNPADLQSSTNIVSNTGVVAAEVLNASATRRQALGAASYGGDKALFGFGIGTQPSVSYTAITNLVSNAGVVAADTAGVGTARSSIAAAGYGSDKALFGFGSNPSGNLATKNLVSNTGVVATDTPGVGTSRNLLAATRYGSGTAIFGFGAVPAGRTNITNLVSNTGVVATDTPGVGTARNSLAAAGYGGDKALFGFGQSPVSVNITNLVSNTGVVATDTPTVAFTKFGVAGAGYGGDKAIFGYGRTGASPFPYVSSNNLVSNTGVVAATTTGQPRARSGLACAGFSFT
jgi:hypothetical protein